MTSREAHPEVRRVVTAVMLQLGIEKPEQLAEAVGLPPYKTSSERQARRWMNGEVAPGFHNLMTMLHKAGLLHPAIEAAWRGVKAVPPALEGPATPVVVERGSRRRAG